MIAISSSETLPSAAGTYDDPAHGNPHRLPAPKPVTNDEIDDAARKTAQIIDADDDTKQTWARIVDHL